MPPRDILLAIIVIFVWGTNFTAMKLALEELPPLLFVGLRFAILVPLLFFFKRPAPWLAIIGVGALLNMGQFAFLFSAMRADASAGLASLLLQSQAPLTILLAALVYGERITWLQAAGIALACAGVAGFALNGGGNITLWGLTLVMCGALSWACGNLILRRLPGVNMLALFIWASLIPPLPMLGLSALIEGATPFATLTALNPAGWGAVLYVAIASTIIGYSIWGALLSRHPAAQVTPFALGIPVVGIVTAAIILGERITLPEAIFGLVILIGIAVAILAPRLQRPR
ncbi:EamA family transporter [Gymnodinialimonas hymeniacidonis]|uniref:EamA family transporter n=1 Tax=Gymnodinialimonas hymeniacidonis TaxID=3126508 RepID=UPI0034C638D8